MKIFLAADHAGFELKEKMKPVCAECFAGRNGAEIIDCGAYQLDPQDDYPDFVISLGTQMQQAIQAHSAAVESAAGSDSHSENLGVIFCRTGTGVAIAANKFHGLRCGNCTTAKQAQLGVEHNHLNVLALAADYIPEDQIATILRTFLRAQPDQDSRHLRRLAKITQIEKEQCQK